MLPEKRDSHQALSRVHFPAMRLHGRPSFLLAVFALGVHGGMMAATYRAPGGVAGYAFRSLDSKEYYQIAKNVAEHGAFSQSVEPPLDPDTWRTPGYPLFLAGVMSVAGDSPIVLILSQQLLAIINVLLVFAIARRYMSERRSLLAASFFLLEPYHLWYSLWLLSTTWFATVLLLAWFSWQRVIDGGRWRWGLALGATTGFSVLVRPVGAFIPIVVVLGLIGAYIASTRRRSESSTESPAQSDRATVSGQVTPAICRPRGGALVATTLALSLVVGAWMVRNHRVAGHFALSDQGGVVLAYFKATEVVLWREGRSHERYYQTSLDPTKADVSHSVWDGIDERLRAAFPDVSPSDRVLLSWKNLAQGNRTSLDSFRISAALSDIGMASLAEAPLSAVACWLARCASILTFPLNLAVRPPVGVDTNRAMAAAIALVYFLLCAAVAFRLARRRVSFHAFYFPLAVTAALLLASAPQIDPRFRVPLIPLLLIVAIVPCRVKRTPSEAEQLCERTQR